MWVEEGGTCRRADSPSISLQRLLALDLEMPFIPPRPFPTMLRIAGTLGRSAHRLDQLTNAPRAHACDPRLLDHRCQRLLGRPMRLQEAQKTGAAPQLGDLQVERPEPGVQRLVAIAVAPGAAVSRLWREKMHLKVEWHKPVTPEVAG